MGNYLKFCGQCGREVPEGDRFCAYCGHKLGLQVVEPAYASDVSEVAATESLSPKPGILPKPGGPIPPPPTGPDSGVQSPEPTHDPILPFYILCDESASMAYNGGIDSINKALPDLHATIAADPLSNERARICVIAFADDVEVLVPLAQVTDIDMMPGVQERGASNYGKVFRMLKALISQDIANLRADGYQVLRPAVFFISDGEPSDFDWQESHSKLTDRASNPHAPNIIAFGVDSADAKTIAGVGTTAAFMLEAGINPGKALREIIREATNPNT